MKTSFAFTRPARTLAPLALAAALTGCSMAPKYDRPAAPIDTAYPLGAAYVEPAAATPDDAITAEIGWRDFFRDPLLQQFLAAMLCLGLFTAARAFPHVTGVFLIVVVPPTVPAQLSAAAARCYGKLFCSLVLRDNKHITPRARRAHKPHLKGQALLCFPLKPCSESFATPPRRRPKLNK